MKKSYSDLNIYSKTFIISSAFGIFVSFVLTILGILDVLSLFIPLGIFIGIVFSAFSYLFLGKISYLNIDDEKKTKYSMAVIFGRLMILISLLVVEVFLQLKMEIVLFNPFGFLGAYFFTSIVYTIFYMRAKKCALA